MKINRKKLLTIVLGCMVAGFGISQVLSLITLNPNDTISAQTLNDNFQFLKDEIEAAKVIAQSNSTAYTGRTDEEIIFTGSPAPGVKDYCPMFMDKDENVILLGGLNSSGGCNWTEAYNPFYFDGKYYFGTYENDNNNLDWGNSKLVMFDPANPNVLTPINLNGPGNDDGFAYNGTFILNGQVYLVMNWDELYSFDGTNLTLIESAMLKRSNRPINIGGVLYYGANPLNDGWGPAATNVLNNTSQKFDFSAAGLPGLNPPSIVSFDDKSELLILQHIDSTDGTISSYLFNPAVPIGSNNPQLILEDWGAQSGGGDTVDFNGSTKNTLFYVRKYTSDPGCTNQDCLTKYFAYDKRTGTHTELNTALNVGNKGSVRISYSKRKGCVVAQNGDEVLITVNKGLASDNNNVEIGYLKYNETTKIYSMLNPTLELRAYSQDSISLNGKIYVEQRDSISWSNLYEISEDLNSITKLHNSVYDVVSLNGNIYLMADPDSNGEYTLNRMNSDTTLTEIHDFTIDSSDPETWLDPVRALQKE